jgi:L-fuconolactonase
MGRWREQIAAIAAAENTVAKLSGLATSGDGDFVEAADHALTLFGPERLMIGSDWPIAPRALDLGSGFAPLLAHVRTWSGYAVAAVTRGTAQQVYRRLDEAPRTG